MKRIGSIYEKICSIENLNEALDKASLSKRNKPFVKHILNNREYYIKKLHDELVNETYALNKNIYKTIKEGSSRKQREITIPKFYPDQIIHWAICLQLKPIFMRGMYHYNCGSIPRRGGIYAKKYIDKIYKKDKKIKYTLKLDIKKFFPNISHNKLNELFATKIKDQKTLKLLARVVENGGKGLPIGYYTSQWFSNFYLEKLDHFIKETLKIRYYIRYVDDMVLIDTNKRKLHKVRLEIAKWLDENNYNLKIKENWQLWRIHSRPLDFLGYKFYQNRTLLRTRIFLTLNKRVKKIPKKKYCSIKRARGISSLLGWLKHIPHGKSVYIKHIKPIISKKKLSSIISKYDKGGKSDDYKKERHRKIKTQAST